MDIASIYNSKILWISCVPLVVVALIQTLLISGKAVKTAKTADISIKDCYKAFRTGAISAIGPSMAIVVILIGLMTSIGAPISFMRVSIGAEDAELLHASLGSQAVGETLGGEDYTLLGFAAAVWGMTTRAISWAITALIIPNAARLQNRIVEKDGNIMSVISIGCMIGIMSFMSINNVVSGIDKAIAALGSATAMLLLSKLSVEHKRIKEFMLGLSMICGLILGMIFSILLS